MKGAVRGGKLLLTLESEELEGVRGTGDAGGLWEAQTRCIMWYSSFYRRGAPGANEDVGQKKQEMRNKRQQKEEGVQPDRTLCGGNQLFLSNSKQDQR